MPNDTSGCTKAQGRHKERPPDHATSKVCPPDPEPDETPIAAAPLDIRKPLPIH